MVYILLGKYKFCIHKYHLDFRFACVCSQVCIYVDHLKRLHFATFSDLYLGWLIARAASSQHPRNSKLILDLLEIKSKSLQESKKYSGRKRRQLWCLNFIRILNGWNFDYFTALSFLSLYCLCMSLSLSLSLDLEWRFPER